MSWHKWGFTMKISIFLILSCLCLNSYSDQKRKKVPALPAKPSVENFISSANLNRVDPHGQSHVFPTKELARAQENCQVCHYFENSFMRTKTTTAESCTLCHNSSPHSGIVEHQKHNVTCLDCHSVHRGKSISWTTTDSSLFKKLPIKELEPGLTTKSAQSAMLKKSCTECHKF